MSRFVEVLKNIEVLNPHIILDILETVQTRLDAESSFFECTFPYFMWKKAPVSGHLSPLKIEATISGQMHPTSSDIIIGVAVPVQTLCPCSKEISSWGPNQQANVDLVKTKEKYGLNGWWKLRNNAHLARFSLLKREDEKHVTGQLIHTQFVEDVARI